MSCSGAVEKEAYEEANGGGMRRSSKRRRLLKKRGCLPPFMEISMEPTTSSLRSIDSRRFKEEIKRWAKAVAAYARRQVSSRFGSSRHSSRSSSTTFDSQTN